MPRLAAILAILTLFNSRAFAAVPLDVYFISVGSGHYMDAADKASTRLTDIGGLDHGAVEVGDVLSRGGAKFGLVLTSDADHYVSRNDILALFPQLWNEMRKEQPLHSFVIIYLSAHGVADGHAWFPALLPVILLYRQTIHKK